MPEKRLKLNLFRIRKGKQPEAIQTYYVLGRKSGGMVARVVIEEDLDLHKNDILVFDFTTEKV